MRITLGLLLSGIVFGLAGNPEAIAELKAQRALFLSGNHTLMGSIYKPEGKGPFPAVVFNQNGSAPAKATKGTEAEPFLALAKTFTSQGYVFFVPGRHKEFKAPGEDQDEGGKGQRFIQNNQHHASNIVAAVGWLRAQSYVDETRIAMMGHGAGAASTLFAADQDMGVSAIVVFSFGSNAMKENGAVRKQLKLAVQKAKAPIFLIQAENEGSLLASEILGSEIEKKGNANRVKVYPPYGDLPEEAGKLGLEGSAVWKRDVFTFLQQTTERYGARLVETGK